MIYIKNKDTFQAELDDEVCLFNSLDAKYLSLNCSASNIWKLLDEPQSLEDLKNKINEIYQVDDQDNLDKNITDFIKDGIQRKIIDVYEPNND